LEEEVAAVTFTDDVIFAKEKEGLFQLIVLVDSAEEALHARAELDDVDRISGGDLLSEEATFLIQKLSPSTTSHNDKLRTSKALENHTDVYRIASGEVFAASKLNQGRPAPRRYDPFRLKTEVRGKKFIILRPDRFVFAACADKEELERAVEQIRGVLEGGEPANLRSKL
jgi:hypothetical protein